MMGFGNATYYTPKLSGKISITYTFQVYHPSGSHDANFTLTFGTGVAPACGDAATGTAVGNVISTTSNPNHYVYVPVTISTTLSLQTNTKYWFDLQGHIGAAVTHLIFDPQMSVIDLS